MADVPRAWTRVSGLVSPLQRPCGACELGQPETTPLARLGSSGWAGEAGFPETAPRKGLNVPRHLASRWGGGGARARREHLISERLLLRKPFPSPRRVGSEPTLSLEPVYHFPTGPAVILNCRPERLAQQGRAGVPLGAFIGARTYHGSCLTKTDPRKTEEGRFPPFGDVF